MGYNIIQLRWDVCFRYDDYMKGDAVEIVKKLVSHGHIAYFAGGWVRDYIMGHPSDDIDIATSASPEQILDLFPRTILVGLQFGVVIVPRGEHQYEVATFRKDLDYVNGRKPERIEKASPQEDALRRDFTINGMFYDPIEDKIHDYVGGIEDIRQRLIRSIGNPHERFFEDRLRMIRAFRFAARFGFAIEKETQLAIQEHAERLFPAVAMERVWQEFCKMQLSPHFDRALIEMHRLRLLEVIFPEVEKMHLKTLEQQLAPMAQFPKESSPLQFIYELFPQKSREDLEFLAKYLKAPNRELELLLFYQQHFPFLFKNSDYENASFYAHPYAQTSLEIYAAHLPENEKKMFLTQHQNLQDRLKAHTDRLKQKKALLTAEHLKKEGILPGKNMGALLKEAEKLSINQNLSSSEMVLEALKQSKAWETHATH